MQNGRGTACSAGATPAEAASDAAASGEETAEQVQELGTMKALGMLKLMLGTHP